MSTTMPAAERRTAPETHNDALVLYGVPWRVYEGMLRLLDDRHLRITYDQGTLEIMTLSLEHENPSSILGEFVVILADAFGIARLAGGSVTLKRRTIDRGLEPDKCWWFGANARKMMGVGKINLGKLPPPDLAIEVDVSHSSIDRIAIYARLGVPEIWCASRRKLRMLTLADQGKYVEAPESKHFAGTTPAVLTRFLALRHRQTDGEVARQFRAWVHKNLKK